MNTFWNRQWPRELAVLQSNPKAVPMASGPFDHMCMNCGGHQVMLVYVIDKGPFTTPNFGREKWLDMPDGKSGWYTGRLEAAPCPVCCEGQRARWLENNCGLGMTDLRVSLNEFRANENGTLAKKAGLDTARGLLGMNHKPSGFVTFWGGFGVGKSHLLKSLVNGFRSIGVVARYWRLADLLADVRERFGDERGAAEEAVEDLRRAKVLCLDEIDRVNLTGWAKETIYRLTDVRYSESQSLLTVMAMNVAPVDLAPEFGYLGSRMRGGKVVEVGGADMRPAMATMSDSGRFA